MMCASTNRFSFKDMYVLHAVMLSLMIGQSNAISAVCVSPDRRWIATADHGADSMIVIWDALTGMLDRLTSCAGSDSSL